MGSQPNLNFQFAVEQANKFYVPPEPVVNPMIERSMLGAQRNKLHAKSSRNHLMSRTHFLDTKKRIKSIQKRDETIRELQNAMDKIKIYPISEKIE